MSSERRHGPSANSVIDISLEQPIQHTVVDERSKAKASYNDAYKEANKKKNELGVKRLKMLEYELDIKRDEGQGQTRRGQGQVGLGKTSGSCCALQRLETRPKRRKGE